MPDCRATRLLVSAADELIAQAPLRPADVDPARLAVVVGTALGGVEEGERALAGEGPRRRLRGALYDAPGDNLARWLGARGPVLTVSTACASGATALGVGRRPPPPGQADLVVAGGYDILCRFVMRGFDALRSLTRDEVRPFDRRRSGLLLGEAGALVLLSREADTGRRPLGWLRGHASTGDGSHISAPDPEGRGLERAVRLALAEAGAAPERRGLRQRAWYRHRAQRPDRDRACSSASSRRTRHAVPVNSIKPTMGHTMGAAATLEAIMCLLAGRHGQIPPTRHLEVPDPECDLDYVPGDRPRPPAAAVAEHLARLRRMQRRPGAGGGYEHAAVATARSGSGDSGPRRPGRRVRVRLGPGMAAVPADARAAAGGRDVVPLGRPAVEGERFRRATRECLWALAAVEAMLEDGRVSRAALAGDRTALLFVSAAVYGASNRAFIEGSGGGTHFAYTAPAVVSAEAAIEYGLQGPAVLFIGGPPATLRAIWYGATLLAGGTCDRALVLAVETFAECADLYARARRRSGAAAGGSGRLRLARAGRGSARAAGPTVAHGDAGTGIERRLGEMLGVRAARRARDLAASGKRRRSPAARALARRGGRSHHHERRRMTQKEVLDELKAIVVERLRFDPRRAADMTLETTLPKGVDGSLGLDSLDFIELSVAMEERFGITVEEGQDLAEEFHSLDSLSRYILAKMGPA